MKPFVEVLWRDAEGSPGWHTQEELDAITVPLVTTRGYLVREDKEMIVLAMGHHEGSYLNLHTIPAGMVRKVTRLK